MQSSQNPQPISGMVMPRFGEVPSFMRLPVERDPAKLDIALCGVPFDGGTTNRPGARHGPREIRNMSSFMRRVHHVSKVAPYELCRVGDYGDSPINPIDLMDSLARIEEFYTRLHDAGATPLTAGGDHLISLPILRAIARERPVGLIHFDAHSDTGDTYFGGEKYTHGTPFRRAVEEGLIDPKRVIQIGIRGSMYERDEKDWALSVGIRIVHIEEYFAEVGGYSTAEAQQMLRGLAGIDIIGGDVVEVAPPFDPSGNTALVGATMMFEILCVMAPAVHVRKARAGTTERVEADGN
jgi:guanidinopropionase